MSDVVFQFSGDVSQIQQSPENHVEKLHHRLSAKIADSKVRNFTNRREKPQDERLMTVIYPES